MLTGCLLFGCKIATAQVTTTPFTVELEEITHSDWPGLQSFASASVNNQWILFCGRTGGLHDLLPPDPFPVSQANSRIFLLDPVTGEQWSASINGLADSLRDQLRSTNTEWIQQGNYLYIIGGYGKDTTLDRFVTFPFLTAVNLNMLSDALVNATDIAPAFRMMRDSLFCVTGGELEMMSGKMYLFGGHVFDGIYSKPAGPTFTQTYTNTLRSFSLTDDGTDIIISDVQMLTDTIAFHRRDLNFDPVIFPGETAAIAAFSGVFQYEADWVWKNPVYVTEDSVFTDTAFSQLLNGYTCPVMTIFDSVEQNYYATFFGGISQYYHNIADDTIKEDLNVPFVKDISTIIRYADGTTEQILQPILFDSYLGANAQFFLNDSVAHYSNGVIQLHHINGTVNAGYIFGGIDAAFANFTPSTASNRLFKVLLHNEKPLGIFNEPSGEVTVFPNPVNSILKVKNSTRVNISSVQIINALGEIVIRQNQCISPDEIVSIPVADLQPGMYFIRLNGDGEIAPIAFCRQ